MKKFISIMLVSFMALSGVFAACDVTGETSSSAEEEVVLTFEEQLKADDKNYDRAIYLTEGDTYDLQRQYEYEGLTDTAITITSGAGSFTISDDVITAITVTSGVGSFTISDGVITANSVTDYTSESVSVSLSLNGITSTESVIVRVFNRDAYGTTLKTIDLGALYGKNVLFFGDSITHNWALYPSGDKESYTGTDSLGYNYIPMLNEVCNFASIVNAAWSGGTVCYVPSSSERYTYKSLPGGVDNHEDDIVNADVIFIFYGTNDLTEQYAIGDPTDTMVTDGETDYGFYAGINYGLDKIKALNPNATVIVMNILVRDFANRTYKMSDYNEALQVSCANHKDRLLDVNNLFEHSDLKTYFKDGLHPNDDGYTKITEFILLDNKTLVRRTYR